MYQETPKNVPTWSRKNACGPPVNHIMERIVVATPKNFMNVYVPPFPKTDSANEISPIKSPITTDFTTMRTPAGINSNANNICVSKDQTDESVITPSFLSKLFEGILLPVSILK